MVKRTLKRTVLLALLALAVAAPASATRSVAQKSWASASIWAVTKAGLFPGRPRDFRPSDPFTAGDLAALLTAAGKPPPAPRDPSAPVTIRTLDAAIVRALGLRPVARQFAAGVRAAGLQPPARFGTEVVARLLGFRTDIADDRLELRPEQPATRADAAFSAARLLSLGREVEGGVPDPELTPLQAARVSWGVAYVRTAAAGFSVPALTPLQQEVLRKAVSLVGYPYVWGGEQRTDRGFDCSGFVWRVFKARYADAPGLGDTLQGRTAAQMAGEVPKRKRIGMAHLEPGDVLFIANGPHSKAAQVFHTSIYLGNGWLIQSSGQGVGLGQLSWYEQTFAWARRPLTER